MKKIYFTLIAITLGLCSNLHIVHAQTYTNGLSVTSLYTETTPPFYASSTIYNDEQILLSPNAFASPAGNITKLYMEGYYASQSNTYANLTIKMGQVVGTNVAFNPTTAWVTGLTTVFSSPSYTINWNGYTTSPYWNSITLQNPFWYNPSLSLIIEISTTGVTGSTQYLFVGSTPNTSNIVGLYGAPGGTTISGTYSYPPSFGIDMIIGPPLSSIANAPPIANFVNNVASNPVWVNSPTIVVNTSANGTNAYWDITGYSATPNGPFSLYNYPKLATLPRKCVARWNNTCYLDTVDYNWPYTFDTTGYYQVKLKVQNTYYPGSGSQTYTGVDSVSKVIYVGSPTSPPITNFFSVKRTAGFQDQLYFYDVSSNGPTSWQWWLNPNVNNSGAFFLGSPFSINQWYPNTSSVYPVIGTGSNPRLTTLNSGLFDVCEKTFNLNGSDSLCKAGYLNVFSGYMMCNGSDSISNLTSGYVYDLFGPVGNYTTASGSCAKGFRISTCADSLYLNVESFRLAQGDTLTIRQGGAAGPLVTKLGGTNLPLSLKNFAIKGGEAFFQFYMVSSTGDSGWAIKWTSKPASYSKPKASFDCPTTIYAGYTMQYTNLSTGLNLSYSWDTNGDTIFGLSSTWTGIVDSITPNPSRIFNTPGVYRVCLVAYNCIGYDTACKTISVLPMTTSPVVNFSVNKTSGLMSLDTFKFYDQSLNGPTQWQWTFNPANYVLYVNGTTANSQNPQVIFQKATCFQITLTATNKFGANTKVSSVCMVNVVTYEWPNTSLSLPLGSDFGISRVVLGAIDTTTLLQSPIYTQMYQAPNLKQAILYRGINNTVTTYRITNNDPMTTKVWIDFNMNGFFTDAGETIISEFRKYKLSTSATFMIPPTTPIGISRMRVGVSYDSTTLTPSVAQLGCFEDYSIYFAPDYIAPVLTLKGLSVQKVEVNKSFVDPMATAIDNLEGDISSRVVRTGNVDLTKVGYYTLTYTAADLYGNVSLPISRVVQVEVDRSGPSVALLGKDTVKVGIYTNFVEPGATATDNNGNSISSLINYLGNVNINALGTYTLTYSVTDAFGLTSSKNRIVQVVDTSAPVILSINGKPITDTVRYQIYTPYIDQVVVTDNYNKYLKPTFTGNINVNVIGYYTLLYTVTDSSGNAAMPYRLIVKIDNTIPPVVTLNGQSPMVVDVFANWPGIDPGVTASSSYYAQVSTTTIPPNGPDMTKLGTTNLIYKVCDASNNCTSVTRMVTVVDRIAPVIHIKGLNPYTHIRFQTYIDSGVYITDNYYTNEQLQPRIVRINNVVSSLPGDYYVTYNVTDLSLNAAVMQQRYVRVVDDPLNGVNTITASGVGKVYPNPSNGKFSIEVTSDVEIESVKVYNILGSLVKTIGVAKGDKLIDIELNNVSEGVYILKMEGSGKSYSQKINIVK